MQDIMRNDVGVDGDAQRISQLGGMLFLKTLGDQDEERAVLNSGYESPVPEKLRWSNWAVDSEGITGDALLDFVNNGLFRELAGPHRSREPGHWARGCGLSHG